MAAEVAFSLVEALLDSALAFSWPLALLLVVRPGDEVEVRVVSLAEAHCLALSVNLEVTSVLLWRQLQLPLQSA